MSDQTADQVPIVDMAQGFTGGDPLNDLAIVLMRAWGLADPSSAVSNYPASFVATFVDMARAALAAGFTRAPEKPTSVDVETITIPSPHVPYGPIGIPADRADASYLRSAVRNIRHLGHGERLWGSNVTETVIKLLTDAAVALESRTPKTGDREDGQ